MTGRPVPRPSPISKSLSLGWREEPKYLRALNEKFDRSILSLHAIGNFIHEIEENGTLTIEGVKYPSPHAALNFYLSKAQRHLEKMVRIVIDIQEAIWEIGYRRVWDVEEGKFKFGRRGSYAVEVHCDRIIEGDAYKRECWTRKLAGDTCERDYRRIALNTIIGI